MTDKRKNQIAGLSGGLINGLFGGGGGMALLPLLTRWRQLDGRSAFATCVAIILPMCCVSTAVYLWRGAAWAGHARARSVRRRGGGPDRRRGV